MTPERTDAEQFLADIRAAWASTECSSAAESAAVAVVAAHDAAVSVAATRKALTDFADELQDGLDEFNANQERFTIGPMFDMGGSTVIISLIARLRARGIAAVDLPWRQIVDSQSHED